MLNILSFGAGVQSTTLLLMSFRGVLPRLDAAIFADTQWEPRAVYDHLEWCKQQADAAGVPLLVRSAGNLRQDLLDVWALRRSADGKRHASIPAFVRNPDGSRGIIRRQCTSTYKVEVVDQCVRELLGLRPRQVWPKTPVVSLWIGISADEFHRRRRSARPAIILRYPLLDDVSKQEGLLARGYTRADCLSWLSDQGYPTPPRSACVGCPFHSDAEWQKLSAAEFADACEVDELIRKGDKERLGVGAPLVGEVFLHSSLIPLSLVRFSPDDDCREGRGLANECEGMCGL